MKSKIMSVVNQSESLKNKVYKKDGKTTKYGICYEFHQEWLNKHGIFSAEGITLEIKESFDNVLFYNPMKIDQIKDINLAYNLYDMGYNSGKSTAIKLLQECINIFLDDEKEIDVDGGIGKFTLEALHFVLKSKLKKSFVKTYIKYRKAKYIDILQEYRESKEHSDEHLMNCLESWNRRCRRIA
jgi:lysozyme family protein